MLRRIYNAHKLMDAACEILQRQVNIMEVCGTHTVAIFRNGVRPTLPKPLKLLSGPGCPVCVTDQGFIDVMIHLAMDKNVIIATYGDMLRVPGTQGSLETKHSSNVKIVLSSQDALQLARKNPDKIVVFIAVGFETTTPTAAVTVLDAAKEGIDNFCILSNHKLVIPAMEALLTDKNNKIDAFLCPGHVSVIIGSEAYETIADQFKRPCVVAGFEPMQIIEGIAAICRQLSECVAQVESIYSAAVTVKGNITAQKITSQCFDIVDGAWRGLGTIPKSTLRLKEEYSQFDAFKRFGIEEVPTEELGGCQCGQVLSGLIEPPECPQFETLCTPDEPVGPCMVSSEGACAAWYKYGRRRKRN